ncbi:MAG: peptidyl-prolyl cis-trans isomerase [Terriglobia bacterium]
MRFAKFSSARRLTAILLLTCGFVACQRTPSSAPSAGLAARVNGKDISRADVEKHYQVRVFDMPQKPAGDAEQILKLEILRDLITGELMAQKAEQLKLAPTEAEVDTELRTLKANASDADFKKSLDDRGITEADLRRDLTRNLLTQKVVANQLGSKTQITEPELQRFYEENKQTFLVPETQYRVGLIVVAENPPAAAASPGGEAVQGAAKVRMAAARLQAGDEFGLVARQFSDDPQTAQVGGDLGYQPAAALDRLGPSPKAALLRMKVGEVSPVLSVPGGYFLVKLLGRREQGQLTLENPEVRQAVQQELQGRRDQLLRSAFTEQLHNEARVENLLAREILSQLQKAP